ncbi:MAG: hypothetical protein ACREJC_16675, partial [Tepidisphaeraceae bacterium]
GSYSSSGVGSINDDEFAGTSLYAISHNGTKLHLIDTGNGSLLGTVDLNRTGTYLGLAVVPEPGSTSLAITATACILRRARRRAARPSPKA